MGILKQCVAERLYVESWSLTMVSNWYDPLYDLWLTITRSPDQTLYRDTKASVKINSYRIFIIFKI